MPPFCLVVLNALGFCGAASQDPLKHLNVIIFVVNMQLWFDIGEQYGEYFLSLIYYIVQSQHILGQNSNRNETY